ncbi:MAG: hypothetical protein IK102_08290 [Treponema sp.]|nr:hypothetical protein [Treponema sp.]
MAKITYDDLFALVQEIELGAKDKTRTLNNIVNPTVKYLLVNEASMALRAGVTATIIAGGGGAATGAIIGSIGGAGTGIVASGVTALGVTAASASAGAAAGASAGSVVPIVGTIVGALVGIGIGVFIGDRIKKKNEEKKHLLHQEVIKKQNTIIRDLEAELNELKDKYAEKVEQNERYKYIISLLMANEELKKTA